MSIVKNSPADKYSSEIMQIIMLILGISMSFEARNAKDSFDVRSNHTALISECYESMNNSYELIKQGYFKESFFSLRSAYELGLLSIYFRNNNNNYITWLKSNTEIPKLKIIWSDIKKNNPLITEYVKKYPFKKISALNQFVHTSGLSFAYIGFMIRAKQEIFEQDLYEQWYKLYLEVAEVVIVLHLLKLPILSYVFEEEFLLRKFGTFSSIPLFGGLNSNYDEIFLLCIEADKLAYIRRLTATDQYCNEIVNWLKGLPNIPKKKREKLQELEFKNLNLNMQPI